MKREKLTNRDLDELAKRLFASARASDDEIEDIASDPRLFESVMSRIAARQEPVREHRSSFAWKPVFASAAIVAAISIPLLAYLAATRGGETTEVVPRKLPAVYTVKETSYPPEVVAKKDSPEAAPDDAPKPEYAVTRSIESPAPKRVRPPRVRAPREPEAAFLPIGVPEKAEDAAIDGRVVRVEVPRAALFAMGVNVPLENGTRNVKADLLLGADGAPKAIRLVE